MTPASRSIAAAACALLLLVPAAALAQTERLTVVFGGRSIGHLTATTDANKVVIDYDYKNNGRGPTLAIASSSPVASWAEGTRADRLRLLRCARACPVLASHPVASPPAPPEGLFLTHVAYNDNERQPEEAEHEDLP